MTMFIYKDEQFGFVELFNEQNGTLVRSNNDQGKDPLMRSFPELLDVGVMGHCTSSQYCRNAGIDCYQQGYDIGYPHMSVSDFELIARQASGKTFQIALGGAGDPNKHPDFEDLLKICRRYRIVPNLTTSGFNLTDKEINCIKKYCGAVAVSWYSRLIDGRESNTTTLEAVKRLLAAGCVTHIHYVVSNETIDEAIIRLKEGLFPENVNAVIFLLYKPVGFGTVDKVISKDDSRIETFLDLAYERYSFRVGFDTCFTPAILSYMKNVSIASIDACEAGMFSMYIDSRLNCFPCSFGIWSTETPDNLHDKTLREVWNGKQFTSFRNRCKEKCVCCKKKDFCRSGCRIGLNIDLCDGTYS